MVKFETVLLLGSSVLSEKLFYGNTDHNNEQHVQQQQQEIELCGDFTGTEGSIQTSHPHKK